MNKETIYGHSKQLRDRKLNKDLEILQTYKISDQKYNEYSDPVVIEPPKIINAVA